MLDTRGLPRAPSLRSHSLCASQYFCCRSFIHCVPGLLNQSSYLKVRGGAGSRRDVWPQAGVVQGAPVGGQKERLREAGPGPKPGAHCLGPPTPWAGQMWLGSGALSTQARFPLGTNSRGCNSVSSEQQDDLWLLQGFTEVVRLSYWVMVFICTRFQRVPRPLGIGRRVGPGEGRPSGCIAHCFWGPSA